MNSKELLEQATAKIERMNDLMASIDVIEVTLSAATKPDTMIAFFDPSLGVIGGAIGIRYILADNVMEEIKNTALKEIQRVRDEKSAELEQLLGIQPVPETIITTTCPLTGDQHVEAVPAPERATRKPASINPEFEAAVQEMIQSNNNPGKCHCQICDSDPVEDKLAGILKDEAQRIEAPVENESSLGKYPPNKRQPRLSDNLFEDIRKMYVDEGKSAREIAEVYKVKPSDVCNFVAKHKLNRRSYDKSIGGKPNPPKQPEETEHP